MLNDDGVNIEAPKRKSSSKAQNGASISEKQLAFVGEEGFHR